MAPLFRWLSLLVASSLAGVFASPLDLDVPTIIHNSSVDIPSEHVIRRRHLDGQMKDNTRPCEEPPGDHDSERFEMRDFILWKNQHGEVAEMTIVIRRGAYMWFPCSFSGDHPANHVENITWNRTSIEPELSKWWECVHTLPTGTHVGWKVDKTYFKYDVNTHIMTFGFHKKHVWLRFGWPWRANRWGEMVVPIKEGEYQDTSSCYDNTMYMYAPWYIGRYPWKVDP